MHSNHFNVKIMNNITNIFKRINQLRVPGMLEVNTIQQQEDQLPRTNQENIEKIVSQNKEALELAASLMENLRKEHKIILDDKNKLLHEISIRDIIIDFERIYNSIFGSQIMLLDYLQNLPNGWARQNIESFWENIRKINLNIMKDWTIDSYLNFLFRKELIEVFQSINYKITKKGSAFLEYISNMKYAKNKIL